MPYICSSMRSHKHIANCTGLLLAAFLVFMATGCAKEEVVAPAMQALPAKAVKPANGGQVNNGNPNSGQSGSSITDDGDDIGDNEQSTKPRP